MMKLQKIFQKKMGARMLRRGMNLWPPLFFAGIRIQSIADDFKQVWVKLNLSWYNRNYVGTQFGGSLYAMTDPFYMLMLMKNLGRRYYVWDYDAKVEFLKPADGAVYVRFLLDNATIASVEEATKAGEKHIQRFTIEVKLCHSDVVVARVEKGVYVRLKPQYRP